MAEQIEYRIVRGGRLRKADAPVVGRALRAIAERSGGNLKPEDVVEEARSPRSPLHRFFEWDDRAAAVEYRVAQARYLIRSIAVVVTPNEGDGEPLVVRAFHLVSEDDPEEAAAQNEPPPPKKFVYMGRVMRSKHMRAQVIASAVRELDIWILRHKQYEELFAVGAVIEEALAANKLRKKR